MRVYGCVIDIFFGNGLNFLASNFAKLLKGLFAELVLCSVPFDGGCCVVFVL